MGPEGTFQQCRRPSLGAQGQGWRATRAHSRQGPSTAKSTALGPSTAKSTEVSDGSAALQGWVGACRLHWAPPGQGPWAQVVMVAGLWALTSQVLV